MNNNTGIYSITSPSGKQYIGSAVSFTNRWYIHLHHLRRNRHHSQALQNAYNKYGEENLVFEKIALCPVTDLIAIEQRFIDRLQPAYNICRVAGSVLGTRYTDAQRIACSARQMGKQINETQRAALAALSVSRQRRVRCVELGKEFESVHAAKRWLHENGHPRADNGSISRCCKGRLKRVYGYTWRFVPKQLDLALAA
jgi:group I intron endonuclease